MSYSPQQSNNPYQQQAKQQAQQYKKQQIETATQEEILILLYDGAIRFLVVAKKAYEKKDIETFHRNIMKSQEIILEFMVSLDIEVGGEVAKNLLSLYEYLHYRLVQANIHKDMVMIDEVLKHLRQLKATWEEAIVIAANEQGQELKLITTVDNESDPSDEPRSYSA